MKYNSESTSVSIEAATPVGERVELFAGADYLSLDAGMDTWRLATVAPDPLPTFDLADYEAADLDWTPVAEYSDVQVDRLDLRLGARLRTPTGYGIELAYLLTDYNDDDPLLEDETGKYSQLSLLLSKSF